MTLAHLRREELHEERVLSAHVLHVTRLIAGALIASACAGAEETVSPIGQAIPPAAGNPLSGSTLWVDPASPARQTATAWRASRPADAAQMDKIASQAMAKWMGPWSTNVRVDVDAATTAMLAAGALPVFVAYNIPHRDCGGASSNLISADSYRTWIRSFADGIGARSAVVILEPDALAQMDCLSAADQVQRFDLIRFAVQTFASKGATRVYIDAGHSNWKSAAVMAQRLDASGVGMAQGFALNVANFERDAATIAFGTQLSALIGGKHFVIDTGRNGLGPAPDGQWCNPAGRALGTRPTTATGNALVDAYLWVKAPGDSDGACNGGTSAQTWMPEYALGLAQRAAY